MSPHPQLQEGDSQFSWTTGKRQFCAIRTQSEFGQEGETIPGEGKQFQYLQGVIQKDLKRVRHNLNNDITYA